MKSFRILFYALATVILIFSVLFFGFSATNDSESFPIREKYELVRDISPEMTQAPVSPIQENSLPIIDYSKILEKYKNQDVARVNTDKKIIALTFDGGGNADGVGEIIRVLSENSIKSTFFLTGQFIEKFPEAVSEIKKAGHEIANHTYSHKNFTSLNAEEAAEEVNKTKVIIEENDVVVAPFFRFPYGAYKKEDIALVNGLGYTSVRWTVDSLGWQGRRDNRDARFVIDRVVGKAASGAIALLHLGSAADGSKFDAEALPDIIKILKEQGYQFGTLSELFKTEF